VFRSARQSAARDRLRRVRDGGGSYELSSTQVRRLTPAHLATLRHVGPYEDVPEALFARLAAWADAQDLGESRIWMGIGHDAPGVTPPEALRFDAALIVPKPFKTNGQIVCQRFAGGSFAVTTHAGPFSTLAAAYGELAPRVFALRSHTYGGGPVVEIYKASEVLVTRAINVTDICLPVTARDAAAPTSSGK
jgi:AraC family transcriptional regulator